MLYFCPCCDSRTVTWDPRCLHFVCLGDTCHKAFSPTGMGGIADGDAVRLLNMNRIPDSMIQKWLNELSDCTGAPNYMPDEIASHLLAH